MDALTDPAYTAAIAQGQRLAAGGLYRRAAAAYQKAAANTGDMELKERALRMAGAVLNTCQQVAAEKTRAAAAAVEADKLKAKTRQEAANEADGAACRNAWKEQDAARYAAKQRERWTAKDEKRRANREAWAQRSANRTAALTEAAAQRAAAKEAKRAANREKFQQEKEQKRMEQKAARAAYLRVIAGYVEQGLTPAQIAPLVHRDVSTVRTAIREIQANANTAEAYAEALALEAADAAAQYAEAMAAPIAANDDSQAANDDTPPAEGATA